MDPSSSMPWSGTREEFLHAKVCEWCHQPDQLVIYQAQFYYNLNIRKQMKKQIIRELIIHKMTIGEIPKQLELHRFYTCPECSNLTKLRRKNQKTITCQTCHQKFKIIPDHLTSKEILNTFLPPDLYSFFISQYQPEIDAKLKDQNAPSDKPPSGIIPDQVQIFCKRCFFAKRKGKILCQSCHNNYHSPRYLNCFDCQPESFKEEYYQKIEPQIRKEIAQVIEELNATEKAPLAAKIQTIAENSDLTIREIEQQVLDLLK